MHGDYQLPATSLGRAHRSGSSKWVILFTGGGGRFNEWETAEGTLEQAISQATCDGRHLNYGRTGYRIVFDVSPNDLLAAWYEQLKSAAKKKDLAWLITDQESYRNYFEDGFSPEECLEDEIQAAQDSC